MKGDKTTVLALIAAVVILGFVGIKSFLDYKVAELEKIHGNKAPGVEEGQAESTQVNPAAPLPPNASTPENSLAVAEPTEEDFQRSLEQMPRSVLPPVPSQLLETPQDAPLAQSPQSQEDVETLRKENELFEEKLNRLRSGSDASPGPAPALSARSPSIPGSALTAVGESSGVDPLSGAASPDGPITGAISSSVESPAFGPMGSANPPPVGDGNPPSTAPNEAEIAALAEQVKRQPSIAKVEAYDPQWAILVLSGGSENNIQVDMRFAVRRGAEILGFIKITEVEPNQSIAELMSPNKYSQTARKPRQGDDVIAFNLF